MVLAAPFICEGMGSYRVSMATDVVEGADSSERW